MMFDTAALRRVALLTVLVAGALLLGISTPRGALAGGPGCCQCRLYACGLPINGRCGTGPDGKACDLIPNATCNGPTGMCVSTNGLNEPTQEFGMTGFSALDGSAFDVAAQHVQVTR